MEKVDSLCLYVLLIVVCRQVIILGFHVSHVLMIPPALPAGSVIGSPWRLFSEGRDEEMPRVDEERQKKGDGEKR